ncbi:MAG: hypothetical protein KHZ01_01685 [Lachnospiraceae bacterium]|nr:hypothetical protein [Lachnospiraceae bacterium]
MKKAITYFMALTLVLGSIGTSSIISLAKEKENLSKESYAEGSLEVMPYGAYLRAGTSSINKTGTGKIYAKGVTLGEGTVSKLSVSVRVERLLGNAWVQQDYFAATKYNANNVAASKTLTVPIGYFYRVKSIHGANTDSSSSWTEGLYI